MVKKKGDVKAADSEATQLEKIQKELPKIVEGHEETEAAIQRCVEVCGPFSNKQKKKKRVPKATEQEKGKEENEEECSEHPTPLDALDQRKKELLSELSNLGMGQISKIKRILKKIEIINEEFFRANLATPLAKHELMTLLAEQAVRLPLWVTPVGEFPPPRVGAIAANDAYKLSIGDYCAAYCEDMWILGEVKGIADNGRYEIRDVDDAEKPLTVLARRRVIPLPQYRADPERDAHAIFPVNAWILALYPQTTVFYKGIVEEPPKKATDPYKVAFDDATYSSGFSPPLEVPQRYVVAFREVAYKPREKGGEKSDAPELTKEEIKEQKAAEREKRRIDKAEEAKEQRRIEKERKKAEKAERKEMAKKEKREEKKREKEKKRKEKALEKKRLAKERKMLKKKEKQEAKEKKEKEEKEETEKEQEKGEDSEQDKDGKEEKGEESVIEERNQREEEEEKEEEEEDEEEEEEDQNSGEESEEEEEEEETKAGKEDSSEDEM